MNIYDPDEVNDNEALTLSEAEILENGDGIDYWEEAMLEAKANLLEDECILQVREYQ